MNNKTDKKPDSIDPEANVRAGGYHQTYDHKFKQTQVPNPPSEKDFRQHQQKKPKGLHNKNYGWKEGFNPSESLGSEINHKRKKPKTSRGGRTGFGGRNR